MGVGASASMDRLLRVAEPSEDPTQGTGVDEDAGGVSTLEKYEGSSFLHAPAHLL